MEDLKQGEDYLVKVDGRIRIATFNGFGSDKGWGGMDWAGDSGHSTDSWMHDQVAWLLPLRKLAVAVEDQVVVKIFLNQI